ncbi:MAG: hypothetical protein ABR573_03950 [Candidatus Dormibacteria bacterium]
MSDSLMRRLVALLLEDRRGVHVREAARRVSAAAAPTARALQAMERQGWAISETVGRRRVYRWANTQQARAAAVLHGPATSSPPSTPVPYFAWDLAVDWEGFRLMLRSPHDDTRRLALTRLLTAGKWSDIWHLVTLQAVARDIDALKIPRQQAWHSLVRGA